jgi:hypothetical protein
MGDVHPTKDQVMTKESLGKVRTLGKNLQSWIELVEDENEMHTLCSMIDHYGQGKEVPTEKKVVNQLLCKKKTNGELRLCAQIGEYNIDNVILDLWSDGNVLPMKTWDMMGKPKLAWSPIQLRLPNQ